VDLITTGGSQLYHGSVSNMYTVRVDWLICYVSTEVIDDCKRHVAMIVEKHFCQRR